MSEETPIFEHDCDACVYLGRANGKAMGWNVPEVDLYFCSNGRFGSSYVMRFGDDGPDYCSGDLENDPQWPRSQETYRRAVAHGLYGEMDEGSSIPWLEPGDPIDYTKSFRMRIG